nr:Transposase and Serine threonine protein kinase-related domain containing protein [Haemonchus contortus]
MSNTEEKKNVHKILEILGKGSFGAVFRVRRLSDDKKLAMKCESYWARRKKPGKNKRQIRTICLFQIKLGRRAADTTRVINVAFGRGTINERTAQRRFRKFRNGDENLEDDSRGGRPSNVDNDELKALVEANPRMILKDISTKLKVSIGAVSSRMREIGKSKKLDKWVPHELSDEQKNRGFDISSALLLRNKNDPFLDRIVTCDENWILYDNRRRSGQWLDKGQAPQHFPKLKQQSRKILQHEAKVYESLRRIDSPHFITLEDRGRLPSRFIFVVMKLVGSTLWDLRIKSPERKFSMVTSIRAAEQTLAGIRDLHLCGYIHRDIKPPNFAIGREEDGDLHTIYIIDFGLSRKYRTENNDLRHEREKVPFRGTTRYASISALELKEQSRKDDVESWWYMVLEWMIGELPWQKIKSKDHDTVRQRKMELREEKNLKKVLEGTPEEYMTRIILYIDTLEYASVPDYDHIAALLEAAMEAYDLKYADPPDWDLMVAYLGPRYEKDPHYTLKS